MFGETDFDPSCSYASISIEEQLNALSVAVNAGKVATSLTLKSFFAVVSFIGTFQIKLPYTRIHLTNGICMGFLIDKECRCE